MHSSNDAAQQPSLNHANLFSFPPTQRNGLLDSPTTKPSAQPIRASTYEHPSKSSKHP